MFKLTTAIKYLFRFFFFSFFFLTGNKLLAQLTVATPVNSQTGTTSTTHNLTNVPAGALLLLATSGENSNTNCSISGNSLTWTKRADAQASNSGDAEIWTAVFTAGGNITVTSTWPGSPAQESVCYVITGQESVLGGASALGNAQSSPQVSITTTKANSILFCVTTDYRATDAGATRMYRSTPVTERFYHWNTNHLTTYHYTKDAATITAYTMGLSAPDMQYGGGTAVLEIRPADGSDTQAPTVNLTAPAAGNVSGTINVTANASDNVGVAGVQFLLDGVNLGAEDVASPYSVSWNTTTATNGTHTLTARARDAAGNTTTSAAVVVTVNNPDTQAPAVSITAPAAAGIVSGTINVDANASDNVGVVGVQFLLDGVNLGAEDVTAPYSVSWNTTTATNGTHTLTARARDAAGNTTTSAAVVVTVNNSDTQAPTVSITAPATGTVSGTINVDANASDNVGVAGVQFLLDGVNLGAEDVSSPYTVSWNTTTATNGTHTLTARARDAAGNTTTSTGVIVTVNNDTQVPVVSITAPAAGNVSGTINTDATASDNVGVVGVQFLLDGANLGAEDVTAPYSVSWNTTTATNGTHTLTARARDAAGNTTTSAGVVVTVNNSGSAYWSLTGNNGTNPLTNFLGTTDAQRLVFRTDNTEKVTIDAQGNVGIGTSTPTYKLDVNGSLRSNVEATFGNGTTIGWQMTGANSFDQFSSYRASGAIINAINGPLYLSGKAGSDVQVRRYIKINSDNNGLDGLILQANSINTAAVDGTRELVIGANQVNALKIFQNGNIALQTGGTYTDAGYKLNVSGNLKVANSPGTNSYINTSTTGTFAIGKVDGVNHVLYDGATNILNVYQLTSNNLSTDNGVTRFQNGWVQFRLGAHIIPYNQSLRIVRGEPQVSNAVNLELDDDGQTVNVNYKPLQIKVNGVEKSFVNKDGGAFFNSAVSIGTNNIPSGYKLAVAGNIIAEKIKIKLQSSGWPDYVFHKQYILPTLKEVEEFIQKNKHLPDVPTASDVEKNGLDLGDNQAILLKKIEELTLYLIEMNKKVDKLAEENAALKKKLEGANK